MSCFFKALAPAGHAADNSRELCKLPLASVHPVGSFVILREVEAEVSHGSLTRKGTVV